MAEKPWIPDEFPTLNIVVSPAEKLEGQWVAHCIEWDLVTQGNSPAHAVAMLGEAMTMLSLTGGKAGGHEESQES